MKRSMGKRISALLFTLVLLVSITGCGTEEEKVETKAENQNDATVVESSGGTSSEKSILEGKTISFMTSQAKYSTEYETMAEAIKEDYGCEVEFQVIPDGEYDSLLKLKVSTSEVPDIFQLNMPTNNSLVFASENCEDLSNEPWVERLVNPELIKDREDGKIYGLPKESSSGYLFVAYNKEVLESCGLTDVQPKTYQEFIDILDIVKEKGNGVTPFYQTNADTWTTQIFMTGGIACALGDRGVEVTDKLLANEIKWTDIPEAQEVLNQYIALNQYMNDDNMSVGYDSALEAICTGKAAMYLTIPNWATDADAKYPDVELGSFIIPYGDNDLLATGSYVQGMYVASAGEQVDVAKEFLNVWSMPKYQNMYYEVTPGFSAFNDVDGGKITPAVANIVEQYINTGNYVYEMNSMMAKSSSLNPDLWSYYVEALMGIKTSEEVFETFQRDYQDYMEQIGQEGF